MLLAEMPKSPVHHSYSRALQGSQESLRSYSSAATSAADTTVASSLAASQTTNDTAITVPASPTLSVKTNVLQAGETQDKIRLHTPENQLDASDEAMPLRSPASIVTPVNGHKRMASGEIKSPAVISPLDVSRGGGIRAGSVGSTGSKASETAATLKERLSYAMAKVQHGWEHHNIDQVEQLAAAAILSPRTGLTPRYAQQRLTQTAGLPSRNIMDQLPAYIPPVQRNDHTRAPLRGSTSPPYKRRSKIVADHAANLSSAALSTTPPRNHSRATSHSTHGSPERMPPSTPNRPSTVRTQTQTAQAEQEAMDALMLMGSPSNGQFPRSSQPSSSSQQQSPRRPACGLAWPRQALQYRSESNDSVTSRDSSLHSRGGGYQAELLRQKGHILDQIEAES